MKIFIAKYPGKYPGMGGGMIIVAANSLNADYSYDIIYSNDKDKMAEDVLEEWYESEKSKEE